MSSATISPSSSIDTNLADNDLKKLPSSHRFHSLWMLSREPEADRMFELRTVQRDTSCPGIHVPPTYWVLKIQDWLEELVPESSLLGVLIRDEYMEALKAVIEYSSKRTTNFPTVVSHGGDRKDNEDDMRVDDDTLSAPFRNPFLDPPAQLVSYRGGFILVGHPGIGKTVWLNVVLILRLQAGLPTIYQSHPDRLYFFSKEGVFKCNCSPGHIPNPCEFRRRIPESTWCLIDCNQDLVGVPMFIQQLRLFIVQASSLRSDHLKWTNKATSLVIRYFMKPWTLSELIVGRTLQEDIYSEAELEYFYSHFGPSARAAYVHASAPEVYDRALDNEVGRITNAVLDDTLHGWDLSHGVYHKIFIISPGITRHTFYTFIPTRYLYEVIRDAVIGHSLGAAHLYEMFVRSPKTKASAGYMLDDAIHRSFPKGGQWKVLHMKSNRPGPKFTNWKEPGTATDPQYLRLGYLGQVIAIASEPLPNGTTCKQLPFSHFLQGAKIRLVDGYYCPLSRHQETLDAFIYEASCNTATIFQATVSENHSIKDQVITWLQDLGVETFRFIAVTTPSSPLDLPFPNKWNNSSKGPIIPEKYLLTLEPFTPLLTL